MQYTSICVSLFVNNISMICIIRKFEYILVNIENYDYILCAMFRLCICHSINVCASCWLLQCFSSCAQCIWNELSRICLFQLDIRTKLCIRDSLYRLAKSAEQRHNCANSSSSIGVERDASGTVMDEETNKYMFRLIFHNQFFFFLVKMNAMNAMFSSTCVCEEHCVCSLTSIHDNIRRQSSLLWFSF